MSHNGVIRAAVLTVSDRCAFGESVHAVFGQVEVMVERDRLPAREKHRRGTHEQAGVAVQAGYDEDSRVGVHGQLGSLWPKGPHTSGNPHCAGEWPTRQTC